MRLTKIALTTCATIAAARGVARAQSPNGNPTPSPTDNHPPLISDPSRTSPSTTPPITDPSPPPPPTDPAATDPAATTPPPVTTPVVVDTGSDDDGDARYSYAWSDDLMRSGIGVSAIIGGGVAGFTDRTMRDTTSSVGGLWDFRLTLGSHIPLGLELGYTGSATNLRGLPAQKGTLIGTTAEAAVRYNVLPHFMWTPYVFGGVGWQRYDVTNANVTLSDSGMNDHDNLLEFPMGAGMAYRASGFVLDVRGTFRAAMDQNLVLKTPTPSPTSSDFASMHTWEASAALGYEF